MESSFLGAQADPRVGTGNDEGDPLANSPIKLLLELLFFFIHFWCQNKAAKSSLTKASQSYIAPIAAEQNEQQQEHNKIGRKIVHDAGTVKVKQTLREKIIYDANKEQSI